MLDVLASIVARYDEISLAASSTSSIVRVVADDNVALLKFSLPRPGSVVVVAVKNV